MGGGLQAVKQGMATFIKLGLRRGGERGREKESKKKGVREKENNFGVYITGGTACLRAKNG